MEGWPLAPEAVRRICHREEGVGADGIVVLLDRPGRRFPLRMFNPDGSEFERSGNGLRVLGAFLLAEEEVGMGDAFDVESGGDRIRMEVLERRAGGVSVISVEMGRASLDPSRVGLDLEHTGVEGEPARPGEARIAHPERGTIDVWTVSVGNPHCVVFTEGDPEEPVDELGAFLTSHPAFRRGTNVQVARVDGDGGLTIAIWERGVGRTAASGTSSCASAVAAVAGGFLPAGEVAVRMAGGTLHVEVTEALDVVLRGPVQAVCRGAILEGFAATLEG